MTGIAVKLTINWHCKHTWKTASYNTSWCLLGCAIGDLGTIAYFQFMGIDWPVWACQGLSGHFWSWPGYLGLFGFPWACVGLYGLV